jgi:tetratricopeptide (TPR) repeat protein
MIDWCWFRITATALVAILGGMVTIGPTPIIVDRAQAGTSSKAKIYVLPYQPLFNQARPKVVSRTTDLLREKMRQSKEVILQNGPLVIPKELSKQSPVSDRDLKLADTLRQDGEAKYRQLRFDEAISSLSTAMNKYEHSLALIADFESVAQTLLMLAVCHFREDHEDQAKEYLAKRILLNPTLALDPEQYPAMFRTLVYSVRSKLAIKSRGELEILANTDGATIYLNGREVGITPIILKNLLPGDYYLRVNKHGLQPWARKVTVVSSHRETARAVLGGVEKDTGPLAEIADAVRANVLTRTTLNKIQAYGKTLKANYMVVGGVHQVGNKYQVSSLLVRIADKHVCALPAIQLHSELLGAHTEVHNLTIAIERQVGKCAEPLRSEKITVVQPLKAHMPGSETTVPIPASDPPAHTQSQPNPSPTTTATLTNSTAPLTAVPINKPAITNDTVAPNALIRKPAIPRAQLSRQLVDPAPTVKVKTAGGALGKSNDTASVSPKTQETERTKPIDEKAKPNELWYESWWFLSIIGAVVVAGCIGSMAAGGLFNR